MFELLLCIFFCSQDDDDDDDSPNFEMELALMEGLDADAVFGEGPENQLTNIKWVRIQSIVSLYRRCFFVFRLYYSHRLFQLSTFGMNNSLKTKQKTQIFASLS